MRIVNIPGTDLSVSAICLGTGQMGSGISREDSFRMLDDLLALGGNFLDTAHVYGDWVAGQKSLSEKTIGAWMAERGVRQRIVLATKGGHPPLDQVGVPRLSRAEILSDLEGSLRFLQVERIDLYWLHRDDPRRPVGELVELLEEQVRAGKIRYYGASNWRAPRLEEAQAYAREHGHHGFVADQVFWNAAVLGAQPYGDPSVHHMDGELHTYHAQTGLAAIPYQSQAYGLFNRMHAGTLEQMSPAQRLAYDEDATRRRYERMRQVMAEAGLTITQVVLGYLTSQPFVTVPIVGCKTRAQLADSLSAGDVVLTTQQVAFVEKG